MISFYIQITENDTTICYHSVFLIPWHLRSQILHPGVPHNGSTNIRLRWDKAVYNYPEQNNSTILENSIDKVKGIKIKLKIAMENWRAEFAQVFY